MLIDTVFKEYPTVIISNLSRNSYYVMSYQDFTDHRYPQAGILSELLDEICSTLVETDRKAFRRDFEISKQLEAFKNGEAKFNYKARLAVKDGHKSIETVTYFINERGDDDVLAVTLCSESSLS